MSFEEIFMERADHQKFEMFRLVVTPQAEPPTITDLSHTMHLSYQQSYNLYRELLNDLMTLTAQTRAAVKKAIAAHTLTISIDGYRTALLEQSIAFTFIDYLIQAPTPSVDKYCADWFVSRSTLIRKTAPVRDFLAEHHLKLSLTLGKIVGAEHHIRLFLQLFYWLGYHAGAWPFRNIDYAQVVAQYRALPTANPDPIIASQERIFWAVGRLRLATGNPIQLTPRFKRVFSHYQVPAPVYTRDAFPAVAPAVLRAETTFFYFFQHQAIRFAPLTETDRALLAALQTPTNPAWRLATGLLNFLALYERRGTPSLAADEPLVMNLLRITMAYYLLEGDYIKPSDFVSPPQPPYQQTQLRHVLAAYLTQLPETPDFAAFKRDMPALVKLLFELLVPYLSRFRWNRPIKVKLVMETADISGGGIIDFLTNLSLVNLLPNSAPLADADLLITAVDEFIPLSPVVDKSGNPLPQFNWLIDATDADYYRLYQTITAMYEAQVRFSI